MKFASELMTDRVVQQSKIGKAKRSDRNAWAESIEQTVRKLSPYPCSYDVSQTQPSRFTEYTYTELLGAMWIATQSAEINSRIMQLESTSEHTVKIDDIASLVCDKYILDGAEHAHTKAKKVIFMPGHNMMDVASVETVHRLIHEDEEVVIKPHPITSDEAMGFLGSRFGWNRIASKDASGYQMLIDADTVYTTTASEFAVSGTALGKNVVNISSFFNETIGAYYCISRLLFKAHKESIRKAQDVLCSLFSGRSGIITPLSINVEADIQRYFDYTLTVKSMYQDFRDKSQLNTYKPKEVKGNG
jgi:hypothetical protein